MLIDIIVAILCAWISYRVMQMRKNTQERNRGSPQFKTALKNIRLEIQKPFESVYLVYQDHDFIFQATNIEEVAEGIHNKYFGYGLHFTFTNKDREVPETEWKLLYNTLDKAFNK